MVLIAGLLLSSFPPERISKSPHHRMKSIERRPAAKTKSEIARSTNSPKSIFASKIDPASFTAYTVEYNIIRCVKLFLF